MSNKTKYPKAISCEWPGCKEQHQRAGNSLTFWRGAYSELGWRLQEDENRRSYRLCPFHAPILQQIVLEGKLREVALRNRYNASLATVNRNLLF